MNREETLNRQRSTPGAGVRAGDRLFLGYRRSRWRGFHFVRRLWCACGGSEFVRVRSKYGPVFEINPVGYIENYVVNHGFYEAEVFDALRPLLGSGAVFWDIGSNLGLHAVTAKTLAPGSMVVAFEPVPALAGRVRANARLNGVELRVEGRALAARQERRTFYMPRGGLSGRGSLHQWGEEADLDRIEVDCVRADQLIAAEPPLAPTVVKLDVEGAEAEVLDGFGGYLGDHRLRAVVFEGAPDLAACEERDPVGSRLCRAGFTLRKLERAEPTQHNLENYLASRIEPAAAGETTAGGPAEKNQ